MVAMVSATGVSFAGTAKNSCDFRYPLKPNCMQTILSMFNVKPSIDNCDRPSWIPENGNGGNGSTTPENGESNNNDSSVDNGSGSGNIGNGNGANGSESAAGSGSVAGVSAYGRKVSELVNEERKSAGLSSLTLDSRLSKVAQEKAEDMRDNGYFSHTSPTYGSPFDMMKQFGISYSTAGENIAKGQRTPERVMHAWMNSQGHRANILNSSYEKIGVGYCTDENGTTYWVQMFIR